MRRLSNWRLENRLPSMAVVLALTIYFVATLPDLGDFPLMGQDEPWIAAPAANLAMHGVYGDDLFAGYYHMERYTFNFPPLFPLTEALAFRLLGVGAWQARSVAVLYGAAGLGLTYALGRRLYGGAVGALAAWLLVGLRLALEPHASGVPFLDLARIARYDIAVPPLMLATLLCFVWAETPGNQRRTTHEETVQEHRTKNKEQMRTHHTLRTISYTVRCKILSPQFLLHWRYLATGILVGLTFLAHVYGGFVGVLIGVLLLWHYGLGVLRRPAPYLIAAGCGLALLPWALYVAQDLPAYIGQMLPEQARFRLWDPAFYLDSLLHEPSRYRRLLQVEGTTVLWPRLGIWVALLGLPLSFALLLRRIVRGSRACVVRSTDTGANRSAVSDLRSPICAADRLMLLALPICALELALLVNLKFYNYIVLLLPFVALNIAFLVVFLWQAAGAWSAYRRMGAYMALGGLLALVLAEGMTGVWWSLRSAIMSSRYADYTARVAAVIPPRARVLALHQFWFGLYSRENVYRSIALPYYFSDTHFYRPAPLPMSEALERIAPEYVLVDRYMAPELRMDVPVESIGDEQNRRFRHYMAQHCARSVGQIADRDYGDLTVYRLCP